MSFASPLMQFRFAIRVEGHETISDIIRGAKANYVANRLALTLIESVDIRAVPWILRAMKQPCRVEWDMLDSTGAVMGRKLFLDAQVVDHSFEQAYHSAESSYHEIEMNYREVIYAMVVPG